MVDRWHISVGDCLDVLASWPDACVDAVCTDPPYGIEFMGKGWDAILPDKRVWEECLRVLKPGGHAFVFGFPRSHHRMMCDVEDAGFQIRDCFMFMTGTGFPKSLNPYRNIMSSLCPSHASAPHAVRLSPPIRAESSAGKTRIALELALIQPGDVPVLLTGTGEEGDTCALMAISVSGLVGATSSNIDLLWNHSWGGDWKEASTSTIETVTRLTTDPAISRFCQSLPTPPNTTEGEFRPDGCECSVVPVAERLSDGNARWGATPLLIAAGNVSGPLSGLEGLGTSAKPAYEPIVLARKPLDGTVAHNVQAYGTGGLNVDGCRIATSENLNGGAYSQDRAIDPTSYGLGATGKQYEQPLGRWPANVVLDETAAALLDEQTGVTRSSDRPRHNTAEGHNQTNSMGKFVRDWTGAGYSDEGGASRFFFTTQETEEQWLERVANLDLASIAGGNLCLQNELVASALSAAVTRALPEGLPPANLCKVPSTNATPSESKRLVESAITAILSIEPRSWHESKRISVTSETSRAKCAVDVQPTGTTTITVSHWRSDGSAEPVTFNITRPSSERGAAACRFRYVAKASRREREAGLRDFEPKGTEETVGRKPGSAGTKNPRAGAGRSGGRKCDHPTVKPVALMRWLVRLITPPGGLVLDPFTGSGTTGVAAVIEGFRFHGCELSEHYAEIARARIAHWEAHPDGSEPPEDEPGQEVDPRQMDLFGGDAA